MITLSFLKYLENNGFGTIDRDLFFQKLALDKKGIYISSIGGALSRGARRVQNFELYARGASDVDGLIKLHEIMDFVENESPICTLPAVPPIHSHEYRNVSVEFTSTPQNMGLDNKDRVIYSITGQIKY